MSTSPSCFSTVFQRPSFLNKKKSPGDSPPETPAIKQEKDDFIGSGELRPRLSKAEKAWIQTLLSRCDYGLGWRWLSKQPRCYTTPNGLALQTFYESPSRSKAEQKMTGDCAQLSSQLGQTLQNELGHKYNFYVAKGNYTNSPWGNHFFLLGWPKRQEATARFLLREHSDLAAGASKIPKHALIVDPTFRRVGHPSDSDTPVLKNYYVEVNPLSVQPQLATPGPEMEGATQFAFDETETTLSVPLGYAGQLAPGLSQDAQDMVCIGFQRTPGSTSPDLTVGLLKSDEDADERPVHYWPGTVPRDTPLYAILTGLENSLKEALASASAKRRTDSKPTRAASV